MLNKKVIIPIVAAILVAFGVNLDQFGIDLNQLAGGQSSSGSASSGAVTSGNGGNVAGYQSGKKWSNSRPAVNLHHVFEGEINRKGKPVGYHSRPGGKDPSSARVVSVRDKPNSKGVYTATIEVRDGNQWKQKFSSFFPDTMSQKQVVDAILHAYNNSSNKNKQPWQGPSGLGFDIQGYTLSKGDINTAFPVYR
ncbi:MAG: EndoU domain-containing protein [Pseudomonadota bacterium]